jgi:hypothetical protein
MVKNVIFKPLQTITYELFETLCLYFSKREVSYLLKKLHLLLRADGRKAQPSFVASKSTFINPNCLFRNFTAAAVPKMIFLHHNCSSELKMSYLVTFFLTPKNINLRFSSALPFGFSIIFEALGRPNGANLLATVQRNLFRRLSKPGSDAIKSFHA